MPQKVKTSSGVDGRRVSRRRALRVPDSWKLDLLADADNILSDSALGRESRPVATEAQGGQSNLDSFDDSPKGYRPSNRYPPTRNAPTCAGNSALLTTTSSGANYPDVVANNPFNGSFCGGIDGGCRVSFYGVWFDGDADKLARFHDRLNEKKAEAQRQSTLRCPEPVTILVDLDLWEVSPHGMGKGIKCAWMLSRGGVKLGIHSNPQGTIPPIIAEFDYQAVKGRDFFLEVVPSVYSVLDRLGFKVEKDILSRVDIQITKALPFQVVVEAYQAGCFCSRWHKWQINESRDIYGQRRIETIAAGLGSRSKTVALVMYDKYKECMDKNDSEKLNYIWEQVGMTDQLTRVEFRIYRDWLREHLIDSVYEFYLKLPDVIENLTGRFFRVLDGAKNKSRHTSQQPIADWWQEFREHFRAVFDITEVEPSELPLRRFKMMGFARLMDSVVGCISSAYGSLPVFDKEKEKMDDFELRQALHDWLDYEFPRIRDDYLRKRGEYLAQRREIYTGMIKPPTEQIEAARQALNKREWLNGVEDKGQTFIVRE